MYSKLLFALYQLYLDKSTIVTGRSGKFKCAWRYEVEPVLKLENDGSYLCSF